MIRPILEYANTVWSPYTKKDISKIERVQRQSARFIMADYSRHSSVTNMLANLNLPSLEYRRTTSSIILFYKIIHNLINIPSSDLMPITQVPEVTIKDSSTSTPEHHYTVTHFFQGQSESGTPYLKIPSSNSRFHSLSSNLNHPFITD